MELHAKRVRAQLNLFKPVMTSCSLEANRKGQDKLGELMTVLHRGDVMTKEHRFERFQGAWVMPRDQRRGGVVLYLHGGGYTCGSLEYAKGFGSTLAAECGVRVFCAAYRLAPEHRYPAALEDALEAYRYLLGKGYAARQILLCGESAGGGLIYALCLKLKTLGLPLPCGLIGISPWTDLTGSGKSYEENREIDPSMSPELLQFYAKCYTDDPSDPFCSPLMGDLKGLPPSLLFVGGDEVMLDDTRQLHSKLLASGCRSKMIVAPERWHAYVLYCLTENMEQDFETINRFMDQVLSPARSLRWMKLDNAAKIYPAAKRRNWNNFFRISATLTEPVDTAVLRTALDVTARRFPSIAVRLRRGVFWYYLEQIPHPPAIQEEKSCPLAHVPFREVRHCAFRVLVYRNRFAVEFFHVLTDGTGALIFVKTLLAEYLTQKYGLRIPAEKGVLGRLEEPDEAELEDSFLRYAGDIKASRRESTAWHLSGTPEKDGFKNLVTMMVPADKLKACAKAHGVTVTELLCAAMMQAICRLQAEKVPQRRRKPVKVLLPVNLRNLFPSRTLRNFASYITPEIDPRTGEYTFDEICAAVHHRMGLENNARTMQAKFAANVASERSPILRVMPLFIKNIAMKAVFDTVGECKSCLCLSNLGVVQLPEVMTSYVTRMDFIIGVQAKAPHDCGVLTWGNTVYINCIRSIRESELELCFYQVLHELGLPVRVESDQR